MKKLIYIFIAVLFCGCTQNNGHIGPLFGTWSLESLTIGGVDDPDFEPDRTFWEFQGDMVSITRTFPHYEKFNCYGTWTREGDRLTLYFNHHDNDSGVGEPPYMAPDWLHFPASGIFEFDVIKLTSSDMVVSRIDEEGRPVVFTLRKIW